MALVGRNLDQPIAPQIRLLLPWGPWGLQDRRLGALACCACACAPLTEGRPRTTQQATRSDSALAEFDQSFDSQPQRSVLNSLLPLATDEVPLVIRILRMLDLQSKTWSRRSLCHLCGQSQNRPRALRAKHRLDSMTVTAFTSGALS